jgi:hypothetical protein
MYDVRISRNTKQMTMTDSLTADRTVTALEVNPQQNQGCT